MATHADWQRAATSWVDEFLDVSSANKKNVHWKEKISGMEEKECDASRERSGSNKREAPGNYDDDVDEDDNRYQHRHQRLRLRRLHCDHDDEQVMSMLTESVPTSEDTNSEGANGNEKGEEDFFKMPSAVAKNSATEIVKNESQIIDPKRIKRYS